MPVIAADTPPGLRPLLADIIEVLRGLNAPAAPTPVFACASAALPPPAAWPRTLLLVTDLNILAHSDGVRWIRQDTGGVI